MADPREMTWRWRPDSGRGSAVARTRISDISPSTRAPLGVRAGQRNTPVGDLRIASRQGAPRVAQRDAEKSRERRSGSAWPSLGLPCRARAANPAVDGDGDRRLL